MKASNSSSKRRVITCVLLLAVIVLTKVTTYYPAWIEQHYSTGIYLIISKILRVLFGHIGFSVGDVLYFFAGVYLFVLLVKIIKLLAKRRIRSINMKLALLKAFITCAIIYIFFNIAWGLNYNRPGIAWQLHLDASDHTVEDLKSITNLLVEKLNQDRLALGKSKLAYPPYAKVFEGAQSAYVNASATYLFIAYKAPSIKRSLYGRMGSFLGFLGYYNPFTGEAQLNLTQPGFLLPYVTCHEMAHQLGYASEDEASFVGYLAATASRDTLFHYSAYFDLFNYANRELYARDSVSAKENYKRLDTLVKLDVKELKEYWRKSDNIVEPFIRIFYDQYLKANQQDEGIKSYSEVVGWLIAYQKKYGKL